MYFSLRRRHPTRGFTLVELAIVLAVSGILFTGLFRLLASGNQQVKDAAVASQHSQLISSVKGFLSSSDGQYFLKSVVCPAAGCVAHTSNALLPIPAAAAGTSGCSSDAAFAAAPYSALSAAQWATWCSAMPAGFSSATTNSYGQNYLIAVRADSATTGTAPPATYSFVIASQDPGGTPVVISDLSGGRIASLIGGDGGFDFTVTPCAAVVCGAFGGWTLSGSPGDLGNYGATAAQVTALTGHVVSRTYLSPEQVSTLPWLARQPIPGDTSPQGVFNTLATVPGTTPYNLYMNATGTGAVATIGGTALNGIYGTGAGAGYGGTIQQVNEAIFGNNDADTTALASREAAALQLNGPKSGATSCTATSIGPDPLSPATNTFLDAAGNACHEVLKINGNQLTSGMVLANYLYAGSFLYGTTAVSDMRLKKDIRTLGSSLDSIMKLKPMIYKYKNEDRDRLGFMAQDLRQIYPQLVVGKPDGYLGVEYMGLLAPMVSAMQELKQQNDDLREQLSRQHDEIAKLEGIRSGTK